MLDQVDLSEAELRRYMPQLVVPRFGSRAQEALKTASVLVIGAGGLGSPVIAYLAAAGVGVMGIADDDVVSVSNLNRQVIYRTRDAGTSKVAQAARFVEELNEHVSVVSHKRIDAVSFEHLAFSYDLIVDGTDNIGTRRIVAAAALRAGRPLVCGAVGQLEGHVAVFAPIGVGTPQGFDLVYPDLGAVPSCEAVGVVGPVAGVIGSLMAMEAIKVLAAIGDPISGRLLRYDALGGRFTETPLTGKPTLKLLVGG